MTVFVVEKYVEFSVRNILGIYKSLEGAKESVEDKIEGGWTRERDGYGPELGYWFAEKDNWKEYYSEYIITEWEIQ